MIELKSPAEIERMRVAGAFVAEILTKVGARAEVGVNLLELEQHARDLIRERGAQSC
jgi:methionyl aminopeptidase